MKCSRGDKFPKRPPPSCQPLTYRACITHPIWFAFVASTHERFIAHRISELGNDVRHDFSSVEHRPKELVHIVVVRRAISVGAWPATIVNWVQVEGPCTRALPGTPHANIKCLFRHCLDGSIGSEPRPPVAESMGMRGERSKRPVHYNCYLPRPLGLKCKYYGPSSSSPQPHPPTPVHRPRAASKHEEPAEHF